MIDLDDPQQVAQADRLGLQAVAADWDLPAQAMQAAASLLGRTVSREPASALPDELSALARLAAETHGLDATTVLASSVLVSSVQPTITFDTHPAYTFARFLAVAAHAAGRPIRSITLDHAWLDGLLPHTAVADNLAKQVALRLYQHIPLIWSASPWLDGIAHDWRLRIARYAESAAMAASDAEMQRVWSMARFPAFWPNGVTVWHLDAAPVVAGGPNKLSAILAARRLPVIELSAPGSTPAEQAVHYLYLGNWVALYLAALYQVDPADRVPLQLLGLA